MSPKNDGEDDDAGPWVVSRTVCDPLGTSRVPTYSLTQVRTRVPGRSWVDTSIDLRDTDSCV